MIGYIYETTNLLNNKKYRGSKKSDKFLDKYIYYGSGKAIKSAVKKYGIDNFSVVLLEEVDGTYKNLIDREDYYIKNLIDSYPHNLIYNISNGAFGGDTSFGKTDAEKKEIRRKQVKTCIEKYGSIGFGLLDKNARHLMALKSASTKKKNNFKFSEETKHKQGSFNRGKHLSEETKNNISNSLRNNPNVGKANRGKHLSEEHRAKISASHIGIGHHIENETKIKLSETMKGHKFSEERNKKISTSLLGHNVSKETRHKIGKIHKGTKRTEEAKKKQSDTLKKFFLEHPTASSWNKGTNYTEDEKTKRSRYKLNKVSSINKEKSKETVYCLSVSDASSYIVENAIVHNCESYLYFAFQYMGTQRDYNNPEYPENRMPKRNNTRLKGGLCKHLTSIIEHIQAGDYYEQMSKDITNWERYITGDTYKSFSKGRNMGQAKKKEKEINWRTLDSFMNDALWAKHGIAKFLNQYNIKKSIADEVEREKNAGEDPTVDEFLDDAFSMNARELAQEAGVDEKAINDYFEQNFGLRID